MSDNDQNDNLIDDAEEATIGMSEIDGFDFGRAVMLMDVMAKCATTGVVNTSISGLAAAALNEMNEEAKAIARRRAEEMQRHEAEARAAAEAERREAEEAAAQTIEDQETPVAPRAIPSGTPAKAPPHPITDSRTATIADNNARRL